MIAYLDSSVLTRAYLPDKDGHAEAQRLLTDPELARVTASITRIEVSGALVRAARARRHESGTKILAMLDGYIDEAEVVAELEAPQDQVEAVALKIVREHGLRALDAWHLAVASIAIPPLADRGEPIAFATRDGDQATVAESLGFVRI